MTLILYRQKSTPPLAQVFGNTTAGTFLRDAMSGNDSVDIVTIGDSNAGFLNTSASGAGYGYTAGLHKAMCYGLGARIYATPLFPGSVNSGPNTRSNRIFSPDVEYSWCGMNQAGATGASWGVVQTFAQAAAAGTSTEANNLKTALNVDLTNYTDDANTRLPKVNGFIWYGGFVANNVNFTSAYGENNYINISQAHPFNHEGSVPLSYRVVYGTFSTGTAGAGKFKARVLELGTFAEKGISSDRVSTITGTDGYATEIVPFVGSNSGNDIRCSFDGQNSGSSGGTANWITGPFAALWHSVARTSSRGMCVSNLIYHGGATCSAIADRVEWMDKLLNSYLNELRNRQIAAANSSGRVIVFVNMGINDNLATGDSGVSYTTAANRIISRISNRWAAIGGSSANLAFVFTATHPNTSAGNTNWFNGRANIVSGISSWASSNAGSGNNVCYVEIGNIFTANRLLKASLYDAGGQSHLNQSSAGIDQPCGYDLISQSILSSLVASA